MLPESMESMDPVPPSAPQRKRKGKAPLVESEVRRSPRIKEINAGFKSHTACLDKNCLPCNAAPPEIKSKVVKNLASSFCKVDDKDLEKKLEKRKKVQAKDGAAEKAASQKGSKKKWN